MQAMTYPKTKVLERLRENRTKHAEIAEEARVGYREEAVKQLRAESKRLRDDPNAVPANPYRHMQAPTNYTAEYDRVIDRLETSEDKEVVLSDHEFNQYMRDEWIFSEDFKFSNSRYSPAAASL